jgi:hypothetical protein
MSIKLGAGQRRLNGEETTVTFYSVQIEARADGAGELGQEALDAFADTAEPYEAVVTGGSRSWSARIRVEASGAADGAALGAALVNLLAKQAGLPSWPIVRAAAVREDVYDEDLHAELARPSLPELVSGPEAAEILGVSVQRVHQLAVEHADFPAPAYKLRAASLWLRPAIVNFGERWDRRRGRPRKDTEGA